MYLLCEVCVCLRVLLAFCVERVTVRICRKWRVCVGECSEKQKNKIRGGTCWSQILVVLKGASFSNFKVSVDQADGGGERKQTSSSCRLIFLLERNAHSNDCWTKDSWVDRNKFVHSRCPLLDHCSHSFSVKSIIRGNRHNFELIFLFSWLF